MINIVFGVIFLLSLSFIIIFFYKKIPLLENNEIILEEKKENILFGNITEKLKNSFSISDILHKFLSRLRIIILKIERKIDIIIKHLRKKK